MVSLTVIFRENVTISHKEINVFYTENNTFKNYCNETMHFITKNEG